MDSAIELDLAKPEGSAENVLDSTLGEAATRNVQQPLIGAYNATTQVSLNANESGGDHGSGDYTNLRGMEKFEETLEAVRVQPQDEGFAAWSYVASAFSMFIVVWGMQSCPVS